MIGNPIEYRNGDLFNDYDKSLPTILVHGCNCQCVMGSGVARKFRDLYPSGYSKYVTDIADGYKLGDVSYHQESKNLLLASALTQKYYGKDDKRYVSYDAINSSFLKIFDRAILHGYKQVVFPKIGAGLGGGDWNVIEACIVSAHAESLVSDVKIICYVK